MFRKRADRSTSHDRKPTMRRFHLREPDSLASVSSNDSVSTAPSSAPRTPASPSRHSRTVEFDPLSLHPTHHVAPPRLSERPFIDVEPREKVAAPPRIRGVDTVDSPASAQEEFALKLDLMERPTLLRSRWSESTISTMSDSSGEEEHEEVQEEGEEEEEEEEEVASEAEVETPTAKPTLRFHYDEREVRPAWQNFSLKRNTVAVPRRRPAMGTGNALDDYVKRGGWKRRGIVFQNSDEDYTERMSSRTVG